MTPARRAVTDWFAQQGWKPFAFQKQVWQALMSGQSGLLHATTGAGKTYAVWLGALQAFGDKTASGPVSNRSEKAGSGIAQPAAPADTVAAITNRPRRSRAQQAEPLTVLWLTPMRALAADTLQALRAPLDAMAATHSGLARWTAGARTGDTSSSDRSAQSRQLPTVLVTTPESLSLLLARADAREVLGSVQLVVADEWHELLGNKRGVQVQLAVARLQGWNPALRVWGMSATLGNLTEAMETLLGQAPEATAGAPVNPAIPDATASTAPAVASSRGLLVQGKIDKRLVIDTLLPDHPERFSWAGHLGLRMLPQVVRELESTSTTLVFVNVRSQAELWYKAILDARPDWAGTLAIHHGSLDRGVREWVEAGLKQGSLRAVVCTSSLDLGVDFLPVERVLQIGSPKGVARLLQRAGRSGHAPGRPSRITLVPTHSLELVEAAAARAAVEAGQVEVRSSPQQPVDVLVQHLVTVALGGGFEPDTLLAEVRRTAAYRNLSADVWQWCLDFVRRGGPSLQAYPDYQRVVPDENGVWRMPDARLARRHRSNIGTIVGDANMVVQILHGAKLGTLEESFLSRLSPGNCFIFAGRVLELVKIDQMTAYVRRASASRPTVPRWGGSRMPLSTVLADFMVQQLALAAGRNFDSPELKSVRPLLDVQERWSALPTPQTLLAEILQTREGWHLFLYPFAGRHAHTGLASLFAWRAAQIQVGTFSIAVNDYGLELLSATPRDWAALLPDLLRTTAAQGAGQHLPDTAPHLPGTKQYLPEAEENLPDTERGALLHEVLASLNATEMARRRFREIARVSGLIFQSHPGDRRSARQLQASSQLFFEVFKKYDAQNMLLRQADEEVLSQELDVAQLLQSLRRMQQQQLVLKPLQRPSAFAFPLMVERFREKLTNENLADRIARMLQQLEGAADDAPSPSPALPTAAPRRRAAAKKAAGAVVSPVQAASSPATEADPAQEPYSTASPALQSATQAVRQMLDFSLVSKAGQLPAKTSRRPRKPSRPLPPL